MKKLKVKQNISNAGDNDDNFNNNDKNNNRDNNSTDSSDAGCDVHVLIDDECSSGLRDKAKCMKCAMALINQECPKSSVDFDKRCKVLEDCVKKAGETCTASVTFFE